MNKFQAQTLINLELVSIEQSIRNITAWKAFISKESDYLALLEKKDFHKLFLALQELRINLKKCNTLEQNNGTSFPAPVSLSGNSLSPTKTL